MDFLFFYHKLLESLKAANSVHLFNLEVQTTYLSIESEFFILLLKDLKDPRFGYLQSRADVDLI